MPTASSSLSALMQTPPSSGRRLAKCSSSSVNGVIGYPAKNRQPAAIAASAIASEPSMSFMPTLLRSRRLGCRGSRKTSKTKSGQISRQAAQPVHPSASSG